MGRRVVLLVMSLGLLAAGAGRTAGAPSGPAKLYYTINSPPQLKVTNYSTAGNRIRVGSLHVVANLPAADGLAFAPDGDLLVGGGKTGNVFKVNPATGAVQTVASGLPAAFHLTVAPDNSVAYTGGLPGTLAAVPVKPFGPGHALGVTGDDPDITTIGFTPVGAFYTSGTSLGSGNFGTFDAAHLVTKRTQTDLRGAHGFSYDPYTKDVLLFGSFAIDQVDPAHPDVLLSQRLVPDMAFDQGIADGQGHLLTASNTGWLVFLDYSILRQVGGTSATVSKTFLDTNLDDIAPEGGQLSPPAAPGISVVRTSKSIRRPLLIVGVIVVLLLALVITRVKKSTA